MARCPLASPSSLSFVGRLRCRFEFNIDWTAKWQKRRLTRLYFA
jgi:hypothetical protein